MIYPFLDPKDHLYHPRPTSQEPNVPLVASGDILPKEKVLAWVEENRKDVYSRAGFDRTAYAVSACHHGVFTSQIVDNKGLDKPFFHPFQRLEAGERLPSNM